MEYFYNIINELKKLPNCVAITLGGSRATGVNDSKSDFDCYVYYDEKIPLDVRRNIMESSCKYTEIGVNYFEEEDDCILNSGIIIELIYRNINDFSSYVDNVLENNNASLGYSTCFFDNVVSAKILHDQNEWYEIIKNKLKNYPTILQKNIIKLNYEMLHGVIASYDEQIIKAYQREDMVSVNHRIAAYLASYFDIIYAANLVYHPGEKRMVDLVKKKCMNIPIDFENNISKLLKQEDIVNTLNNIYNNLSLMLKNLNLI